MISTRAFLLHALTLYLERPCSFLFVVFGNAPTFPALLQFSLNTTVIGLISYLRPGGEWAAGAAGGGRPSPQHQAVGMLGWQ